MNRVTPTSSAIYGLHGKPIGNTPWRSLHSMFRDRPVCRLLFPFDGDAGWNGEVSIICALPAGDSGEIAPTMLARLVAVADAGEAIAFQATSELAIANAIDTVTNLVGGGHV